MFLRKAEMKNVIDFLDQPIANSVITSAEARSQKKKGGGNNPPSSANLRIRRNVLSLSKTDIRRLTSAFDTLKRDQIYDTFVERHFNAMEVAHQGPFFLPWHRKFVEEMEAALLAIDPSIKALPYWPWEKSSGQGSLWTASAFGPDGDPRNNGIVKTGPFADWQALIYVVNDEGEGSLKPRQTKGLVRRLGRGVSRLPTQKHVDSLYKIRRYDSAPWNTQAISFRNQCEGWYGPGLHNLVHIWVGGDMTAATSPNDPIFFLHHANIDRIWWNWQQRWGIANYQGPPGRGQTDQMPYLLDNATPADVFDIHARGYTYQ
jgi:tyrosinase